MDMKQVAKSIGEFFGTYTEEAGKLCIDNGEQVFRYDSPEELLKDWVETLVCHQKDAEGDSSGNWEEEIVYIYTQVIGKSPKGVRMVEGPHGIRWYCYVDVPAPGKPHGVSLHLGAYSSIVDAISTREKFLAVVQQGHPLEALRAKAKEISLAARDEKMKETKAQTDPVASEILQRDSVNECRITVLSRDSNGNRSSIEFTDVEAVLRHCSEKVAQHKPGEDEDTILTVMQDGVCLYSALQSGRKLTFTDLGNYFH